MSPLAQPTFLGDALHQQVELLNKDFLLTLHHPHETDTQGSRHSSGVIPHTAFQLLCRHVPNQGPEFRDFYKKQTHTCSELVLQHTCIFMVMNFPAQASPVPLGSSTICLLWRKATISSTGRKPHMPSKGVRAMAISGLWLASG